MIADMLLPAERAIVVCCDAIGTIHYSFGVDHISMMMDCGERPAEHNAHDDSEVAFTKRVRPYNIPPSTTQL